MQKCDVQAMDSRAGYEVFRNFVLVEVTSRVPLAGKVKGSKKSLF